MFIKQLSLVQFRNYNEEQWPFHPSINILTGLNGMGKTNVLEAIYFLCMGKGYFSSLDKYSVKQSQSFFRIAGIVENDDKQETKIVIKYKEGGRKEIEINGAALEKLSDHVGKVPCVLFSPEDVTLLLDTSEARRNFLNNTLVQYDTDYLKAILLYNKLLKSRNAYLKQMSYLKSYDEQYLESLEEQMALPAAVIFEKRKELVLTLNGLFEKTYALISGEHENCSVTYQSQLFDKNILQAWKDTRNTDKILSRTGFGIHKDDILLWMNEKPIKHYGSQGQLKSFVLSLKMAQYHLLKTIKNTKPIIMLDDIFDKLDNERVRHLFDVLSTDEFGQVFITDTDQNRVPEIIGQLSSGGKQFTILEGTIQNTTVYEPA